VISFEDEVLLVVAPHQDDEVLGCGGLMRRVLGEGGEVHVLSLCDKVVDHERARVEEYRAHLRGALDVLFSGIAPATFRSTFCGFETEVLYTKWRDVMVQISEQADKVGATVLALPWRHDLHQDHRTASMAGRFAGRAFSSRAVLEYEVAGSTDQQSDVAFCPNVYLPLESYDVTLKQEALRQFEGELRPWPHPRSEEGVKVQAQFRGMQIGALFAEAFCLYRTVL